jgi:protein phosphatase
MEDITAEYAQEQLVAPIELRVRPKFTIAAKTDLGRVRENNEDKFEFFAPENEATLASRGQIFMVCDGMGGHAAGQIASEIACKTFIEVYLHHPSENPAVAMLDAVKAANRFVLDNSRAFPTRRGMGTTLSTLILLQDRFYTVQVGDSRVYLLRDGQLAQLTMDHTWVEEAIREGILTPAEGENHPNKHVLTRAVGAEADVHPDIATDALMAGDIFVLCSDGLINHVDDDSIRQIVLDFEPADAAWNLVGAALQGGGSDNTTVLVVRIDALDSV